MTICLNSINYIGVFFASIFISYILYIKNKKNHTFTYVCIRTLYIVFFICITVFPITILGKGELDRMHQEFGKYIKYYQFIPFKTILGVGNYNFFRQIICNILLFVPMPVFVKISHKEFSRLKVILICSCCSLLLETVQLGIDIITRYPSHVCDIDDFILNSTGVIIGYLIYFLANKLSIVRKISKRLVYEK